MEKIINIVVNSFVNDARVLRTAVAGKKTGREVFIIAQHKKGLKETEVLDGCEVIRLKLWTQNLPKKPFFQLFKYIEFILRATWIVIMKKPSLVHAHDLNALPIGYLGKIFTSSKLIYDSHELFLNRTGKIPFLKIGLWFERTVAKKCDLVITVSESIAVKLHENLKLINKPTLILNVPLRKELDRSKAILREKLNIPKEKFIFLYQGGLQMDRGVELIIEAMTNITRQDAILVIVGDGNKKESLMQLASSLIEKGKIIFHPPVPQNQLHYWTMGGDVGIHPMIGSCLNHLYALPNKLFEYIQSGLCVIVSDLPEMSRVVNETNIGLVFKDRDSQDLQRCMEKMMNDNDLKETYDDNLHQAALIYNWEQEEKKLLTAYKELLN